VHIHPIKWTSELYIALRNMVTCYRKSVSPAGICDHPFLVFQSHASQAGSHEYSQETRDAIIQAQLSSTIVCDTILRHTVLTIRGKENVVNTVTAIKCSLKLCDIQQIMTL
jgi:hypothetical protein